MQTYDLSRYTQSHQTDFCRALSEIQRGRKETHWMWYIFPQIQGLGHSPTAVYYAIQSAGEARAFLKDPYLIGNLCQICSALLELNTNDPLAVFGHPDNMKLKSSMTLFACVADDPDLFKRVLDKFFDGEKDEKTLQILGF